MAKNKGLGKGLGALFTEVNYSVESEDSAISTVRLSDIEPDKEQPRKLFNEDALATLAESIERHGILQPIVVRKAKSVDNDTSIASSGVLGEKYTIISGERRWRAAKMAHLTEVPVVVKDLSDSDVAAIMLVENLQREDLNPVELAKGLERLIQEFNMTQEEAASVVGISRPALTNLLRLLSLPEEVLDTLANGDITQGHARALLSLANEELILDTLQIIVAKGLSVRETEKLVKDILKKQSQALQNIQSDDELKRKRDLTVYISKLEEKISSSMGRKISISSNKKKPEQGKIEIEYYDNDDLEALIKEICKKDVFIDS